MGQVVTDENLPVLVPGYSLPQVRVDALVERRRWFLEEAADKAAEHPEYADSCYLKAAEDQERIPRVEELGMLANLLHELVYPQHTHGPESSCSITNPLWDTSEQELVLSRAQRFADMTDDPAGLLVELLVARHQF